MFHVDLDVFLVVFPFRLHASQNTQVNYSPQTTPKFSANGLTQRLPLA